MRVAAGVALVALLLAAVAIADVVDTTDATFDEVIKGEFVLMEFYAPWCGHCKKLEPEYIKAAEELKGVATLAKLDATKETQAAGKYDVQGYPTIKIFRDGVLSGDYNGGRTAPEMVKYIRANVGPAVKAIANAEELKEFKAANSVAVVLFLESVGGDKFEAFEAAAKRLRSEYTFGIVTDSAVTSAEGQSVGGISMYQSADSKVEKFEEGETVSEALIADWVRNNGMPIFDEIGPHNFKQYMERKLPIVWVFTTPADAATLDAGRTAAPAFKGKLSVVWIDSAKYGGMAQRMGLSGNKFPAVVIDLEGKHFTMPEGEPITAEAITAFAEKYLAGSLKATVRSEAAPAEHTVNGLTTVVGETFTQLIDEADSDVFIEFYAPWCGHCKQLAPAYEGAAAELKDSNIRVAKIDASSNDFPQDRYPVQGFPTMFFVPKNTRKPEMYEGGRTQDDFVNFLKAKLA